MLVLGVWDGHDAGACIVEDGRIKVAINEERLTRRKLDIGFPVYSIKACLRYMKLRPENINHIACCSSQFSRVLARSLPFLDKNFYNFRRRAKKKPRFEKSRRLVKYRMTEIGSNDMLKKMSNYQLTKKLNSMGFRDYKLHVVDHHTAHAASAALCSGFKKALCITLDGVGDGLSGTVNVFDNGEIQRLSSMSGRDSIGMMYEQVTTLLGMRELEDEGKTMCVADYSYHIPDEKNRMIDFFTVKGIDIKSKYSTNKRFNVLENILWNTRRENFAYMAQIVLEKNMTQLFANAVDQTGLKNVCWSGGVASNIKANRIVRLESGLKEWFVFPHMGDGGLAVGAALYVDNQITGSSGYRLENAYLGVEFGAEEVEDELKRHDNIRFEERKDVAKLAGTIVSRGNFLFWFQGRMELGPRALGNRSVVAHAGSAEIKNKLNLLVKKRDWFQPFCPSLIDEDANKIFEDYDRPDRFMTMGYMTREKIRDRVKSVIHVDGSSRPQMVGDENEKYRDLIKQVKRRDGYGIILNTSFNIHGEPIVCSPRDAIDTMVRTKTKYMVLGNFFVELT